MLFCALHSVPLSLAAPPALAAVRGAVQTAHWGLTSGVEVAPALVSAARVALEVLDAMVLLA